MPKYRLVICDKIGSSKKIQKLEIETELEKEEILSIIKNKHNEIKGLNLSSYGTAINNVDNVVETYFFDSFAKPLPELNELWNKLSTILPFMQNTNPIEIKL